MWLFKKTRRLEVPSRISVSIRMEAVGGQGANSAGKIVAEAAVLRAGNTGNHFSSFGSEKRGTPVRSFVRFSTEKKPIRSASFIEHPDILVIFHESLMDSHPEILEGVTDHTDIIISSEDPPEKIRFPAGKTCRNVMTVPAVNLARKMGCGQNAVLLGALSALCPEVTTMDLRTTLKDYFSEKGEQVVNANLKGFDAGVEGLRWGVFSYSQASKESAENPLPEMGWLNSPIGGVITNPGNSVLKDHSASRKGVAPKFTKELCFNCGYCDMVCPDFCFVWDLTKRENGGAILKGIDYQYCKGCQKCVAVCPAEALKPVLESEITEAERTLKSFPEVDRKLVEERWKHMDWVAYVDQLSDQDRMLTIQTELLNPDTYLRPQFPEDVLKKKKE